MGDRRDYTAVRLLSGKEAAASSAVADEHRAGREAPVEAKLQFSKGEFPARDASGRSRCSV
ncbi:MAG: hypothetical protein ACLU3U_12750 [Gallintestinimicrobium sp.]